MTAARPEVWLRGPVPGVPPLLQPAAHALLGALEEVERVTIDFPEELLWKRPAGLASVGFHLQHLTGVIDRLLTYARGEPLDEEQLAALRGEGDPGSPAASLAGLRSAFHARVHRAVAELGDIDESTLTEGRTVGRAQLPSTVQGLIFHAAEHSQRHVGQLLVTARVLIAGGR
jgi:uncharacterized damage-inducible protein DinB